MKLINPEIHSSTWIPVGKSNMEALNHFVGSHKRYITPTEFGSKGEVRSMLPGAFSMKDSGVFLTPEKSSSTNFLLASVREKFDDDKVYGLHVYKNGLTGLGISVNGESDTDKIKILTGKLAYKICDCIFPVLSDQQRILYHAVMGIKDENKGHHLIQPYSLIIADAKEYSGDNSNEVFSENSNTIEALTDWVIAHNTIDNCHIFIGMSACLCIGSPNDQLRNILRKIQFLQVANKTAHHLHTTLWCIRKQVIKTRKAITRGNYKTLKNYNEEICSQNSILLKVKVFDEYIKTECDEMTEKWKAEYNIEDPFYKKIHENFSDEVEKCEDRNTMIDQLIEELSILSSELENRLELIMTRDSMILNIILLIMTVLSAFGVAEIVGFSSEQWKAVAVVIIPFTIAAMFYLRNFLKNFFKRL